MKNKIKFTLLIFIIILINVLFYKINFKKIDLNDYKIKTFNSIEYPYFNYKLLDNKIKEYITSLNSKVTLEYKLNTNNDVLNIFFKVTEDDKVSYKNFNISIKSLEIINNNRIIDLNIIGNIILEKFQNKYSKKIYEVIESNNYKNMSLEINENRINIYYDNHIFKDVPYEVYVTLKGKNYKEVINVKYDKVVAFTFDDGPSKYTIDVVDALLENDAKGTFFELGNRMKYSQNIIKELTDKGMEVGSHTYSHKNLNNLSKKSVLSEINSTNIIYNEITGSNIKFIRPPYGNLNEEVKSDINMPIILWSLDTKDWLYKDDDRIYSYIINNIKDGDIVLMHDIHETTLEAVKRVLPILKKMGYKVTTVSELASLKGYTLENGKVYNSFK